jgi:hypothetical protein
MLLLHYLSTSDQFRASNVYHRGNSHNLFVCRSLPLNHKNVIKYLQSETLQTVSRNHEKYRKMVNFGKHAKSLW